MLPISKRLMMIGEFDRSSPVLLKGQWEFVAWVNACSAELAEQYIYASSPEFFYRRENGAIARGDDLAADIAFRR
jgi:hypothetical protein